MIKISKTVKCLVLSGLLLSANCQKAEAFFYPPLPGEPSLDALNNGGKIGTVLQEGYHTGKAIVSGDIAGGLKGVKGLLPDIPFAARFIPQQKGPSGLGESKVSGNKKDLGISDDSVDEAEFFKAFHTLFFTYDFGNLNVKGQDIKEGDARSIYRRKAVEFKQDIAINTYITAAQMEKFLVTIDNTLDRLEKCQNGELSGDSDCTFFGLTMEKIEAEKENFSEQEGEDEDNTAQLGAARNAYIVSTVQNRLLRIIEELTALEAVFQSSRQIDIARPIDMNEQHSSIDRYNQKTYDFAYNDSHNHALAKGSPAIKFNDRIKKCDGKSNNPKCPSVNKDKADIDVMADTAALKSLPDIEEKVDKAVAIHNLKSMMYQYKIQYRQYLLQKKIYENAKKLVKNSDKCVVDFLTRHSEGTDDEPLINARQIWYGGGEPTESQRLDYANRKGLSGNLIKTYDEISTNIAIGSSKKCDGYYEENSCPAGYTPNKKQTCEENGETLYLCEVELVTEDLGDAKEITRLDDDPVTVADTPERADTDGFIDGANAEKLEKESRNSMELTWNLGREALLQVMKNPDNKLIFAPWNDQKILQEEYLRNKYRNIKLIIESTDQGVVAYKLASKRSGGYRNSTDFAPYIQAVTSCEGTDEAKAKAKQNWCTGSYVSCTVTFNSGVITTKVKRKIGEDSDGKAIYKTETHEDKQMVSLSGGKCTYKKTGSAVNTSSICLTPQCLVNNYFAKKWPTGANGFYNDVRNKGRVVAMDKMEEVITERKTQENKVQTKVAEFQDKIKKQERKVSDAIGKLKTINVKIDVLRKEKNNIAGEKRKTEQRITSLTNEIAGLKGRKNKMSEETNKKDREEIDNKVAKLETEKSCITGDKSASASVCSNYVISLNSIIQLSKTDKYEEYMKSSQTRYVPNPNQIETEMNKLGQQIGAQEIILSELKNDIQKQQDNLAQMKEDFAEEYIKIENAAQKAIEDKNLEYERFLDPNMDNGYSTYNDGGKKTYRMKNSKDKDECYTKGFLNICTKHGMRRIKEDNLSTTITTFIQPGKELKAAMVEELNATFFSPVSKISNMLTGAGVPNKFYLDDTFKTMIGISGNATPVALANALKDKVIDIAAEELKNTIEKADKDVAALVDNTSNTVKTFAKNKKVDGESNKMPSLDYLMSPSEDHRGLLVQLRNQSNKFADEGVENLFGIPANFGTIDGVTNDVDDSYFVALPARGDNYSNKPASDTNAGRDFAAPKEMLSSLPPLREVFYFNAADYEDFPKEKPGKKDGNKSGKPVLTELLLCKNYNEAKGVCETEYLPEVWLHLLARPNLREDHKYWQTFVERSFGGNAQLSKLVQNQIASGNIFPMPKGADYRTIIARAGVYPCKVPNGTYIDIVGSGDNVGNLQFKKRTSLPVGVTAETCQEVSLSGQDITHLLADKKINTEKKIGTTSDPMYPNHSELGQLLTEDLRYRPLQENIQRFLLNTINKNGKELKKKTAKDATKNDITRQKAERASFKRNALGSFLDAMTTEYNARKSLEQSKQTIAATLQSLCAQVEELSLNNRPKINGCKELLNVEQNIANSDVVDIEKTTVVDTMKLADTYDTDNKYFEGTGDYAGIDCKKSGGNIYKQIFCMLDDEKDNYVSKAQTARKGIDNIFNPKANGAEYIKERLDKIDRYIGKNGSLIKDSDEETTIRPDTEPDIENSHANRKVEIATAEEGLEAMANQSQAVAYCPVY